MAMQRKDRRRAAAAGSTPAPLATADVLRLREAAQRYGDDARRAKAALLGDCRARGLGRPRILAEYHDALLFIAAYADDEGIAAMAEAELARCAGRREGARGHSGIHGAGRHGHGVVHDRRRAVLRPRPLARRALSRARRDHLVRRGRRAPRRGAEARAARAGGRRDRRGRRAPRPARSPQGSRRVAARLPRREPRPARGDARRAGVPVRIAHAVHHGRAARLAGLADLPSRPARAAPRPAHAPGEVAGRPGRRDRPCAARATALSTRPSAGPWWIPPARRWRCSRARPTR